MRITVHYLAQLKKAAGAGSEDIVVDAGCTVAALLTQLAQRHGQTIRALLTDERGKPQPSLLVFVGDDQVRTLEGRGLNEGDVVTLLTPMAGG
jgi:molybdopterin converting factor small subunit